MSAVSFIATEQFVTAVAREHDSNSLPACHLSAVISGDCGRVTKRFVKGLNQLGYGLICLLRPEHQFEMARTKSSCSHMRIFEFVESTLLKSDRECVYRGSSGAREQT